MDTTILKIKEFELQASKSELFLRNSIQHNLISNFLSIIKFNEGYIGNITHKFRKKRIYQQRHFLYERDILIANLISDLNRHLIYLINEKNEIDEEKVRDGISIRTPYELINKVHLEFTNKIITALK